MKNFIKRIVLGVNAILGIGIISQAAVPVGVPTAEPTAINHAGWSRNAIIYEVNLRQYTADGTLQAFDKELPRLKELGVDILWFMPIHPISEKNRKGTLGSYYAVRDYKAVNPEFGTLEDFRNTVKKAHDLGMKVIIDWVPNHSGCDNVWIVEHPDWYARNEKGEMYGPYDWTDVYKFDYSNPAMRAGMIDALRFWLTEAGIDGFRCDVAGEVPTDFWNEARPQLVAAQPELFMLAEASKPELHNYGFDMAYNWPMKDLFSEIAATAGQYTFVDTRNGKTEPRKFPARHATDIDSLINRQAAEYPADTYMMQMITNHDLNSWEGTEFERLGNLSQAFAVLSYTLPGMPLIYTGQETGLNRAFEFFEKDKAPRWEPRNEYFTFYQKLGRLKHNQPALQAGNPEGAQMFSYPTESRNLYVFERILGKSRVVVAVNLGNSEEKIVFTDGAPRLDGMINFFGAPGLDGSHAPAVMPGSLLPGQYAVFATPCGHCKH
ncbi:MAG: alpha-amylase family glycosyl hydrolase [Muribaculaceae bacterium]